MSNLKSYGVIHQNNPKNEIEINCESFQRKGFVLISSGYNDDKLEEITNCFEETKKMYSVKYSKNIFEIESIRGLFFFHRVFLDLAQNKKLNKLLKVLFDGAYMLNQQNGLINSPNALYEQSRWHRDLPYQHFVSSKNIAINVIFCIDSFDNNNGASLVLPYSHLFEEFPSPDFVEKNKLSINAKKGDFIILNAMTYHRGGDNVSSNDRRGINTVYSIPYIRHQIDVECLDYNYKLSKKDKIFLGHNFSSLKSIKKIL